MRAAVLGTLLATVGAPILMRQLAAAAPRALLEIWGVAEGDEVEIDGDAVTMKGSTRRPFTGEAVAGQAPVTRELAVGKHAIVVHLKGCAPQSFEVELTTPTKRSIVMQPPSEHCELPLVPTRAEQ